jgi:hypothetical protein
MSAHDLAIGRAERFEIGQILVHVAHVPSQPHDMPRRGTAFRQHRGDVRERLFRLRDEAFGEAALPVLADHAADEYRFTARADAVGETARLRPSRRLQQDIWRLVFRHCGFLAARHCRA